MSQNLLVDPCDSKGFMNPFQFFSYEIFFVFTLIFVICNNDVESSAEIFRGSFTSTIGSHDWNDYSHNCGIDGFLRLFIRLQSSHL